MNINWDNKYSVGNEKIDNEHKVFIDLIRACDEAIENGVAIDYIDRILNELMLYAKFHFYSEETLMVISGYGNYESHREEHGRLIAMLEDKIRRYKYDPSTGRDLIEFIFQWFALHTTTVDKELAIHLDD